MAMCNITGYLYDATGAIIQTGLLTLQLQQDMVYNAQKVAPFKIEIDLSTTAGYIDVTVYPTIGASPADLAYKLEFDPDPDDTTKPMKSKPGYFRNYIQVPDQASATLGSYVSALRGQPAANYMPVGGSVGTVGDDLTLGTGNDTNKRIIANTADVNKPEIRYNHTTNRWQFSDDGSSWQDFLQGGGGAVGGDLSGTVGAATVIAIRGQSVSVTAPSVTGQILRWNNTATEWEPSTDATTLSVSASNLTTGTVPLARLSGITNTEISATAAIAWSKVSKTGSSLADLTTRSATDLNAGTVPTARLGSGTADNTTFLRGDNTWAVPSSSGDVVGPAGATDDRIVTFDGATGKLVQDGGKTIAEVEAAAVVAAEASILPVNLASEVTGDLPLTNIAPSSAAARLLGRGSSAGAGDWEEITLGSGLAMSGNTLTASGGSGSGAPDNALYVTLSTDATLANERVLTGSGRVSVTDGGAGAAVTLDVPDGGITYAKMQDVSAASKLLGRGDSGTGDVQEITLGTGLSMSGSTLSATTVTHREIIGIALDGGGSAITTGWKGYRSIPLTGTIVSARILADQTGSIVIDVWKDTYANFPPTVADTITASAKPTVSSAVKSEDTTLTGWTTAVTKGEVLGFNVDSCTGITWAVLELEIEE